jgi:hypothetical protein
MWLQRQPPSIGSSRSLATNAGVIFPEGMTYSKKTDTVRTPRVNELIRLSSEMSYILAQKETGQITVESVLSRRVHAVGECSNLLWGDLGLVMAFVPDLIKG